MEPTGEKDSGKMMVGMGHMLLEEINPLYLKGRKGGRQKYWWPKKKGRDIERDFEATNNDPNTTVLGDIRRMKYWG